MWNGAFAHIPTCTLDDVFCCNKAELISLTIAHVVFCAKAGKGQFQLRKPDPFWIVSGATACVDFACVGCLWAGKLTFISVFSITSVWDLCLKDWWYYDQKYAFGT